MAPRLRDNGYHPGFSGALIASSGVLGILIPPSMLMILYAWVGGQSVLASFLATVVPGLILIVLFSAVNLAYSARNPNIRIYSKPPAKLGPDGRRIKEKSAIPSLLMPVIILGSIDGGVLTPTEAAALSFLYAIPVGFLFYKRLDAKSLRDTLVTGGITTGVIMIMLFSVMILSRLYVMENLPQKILALLLGISENKITLMIFINIFMVIVGMLMDDVSGVLLCTPILLPIAMALGVSPVHFAAIVGVNLGMGNITPPTAPLLYLAGRVAQAEVRDMLKPTMALIVFAWLPTLILTTYLPSLSTWLPSLFGYA
jgi:tripartite ATP-independent transporter DctM subunit